MDKIKQNEQQLFTDISQLIDDARLMVSKVVASGVTALYWNIGTRINKEILNNQRAEYDQQIVATLARQLVQHAEYLPNNLLKQKLHQFMLASKRQIENHTDDE